MKKNTRRPEWKLKLNRETLQGLEKPQLEIAVGGSNINTVCLECPATHRPTCLC